MHCSAAGLLSTFLLCGPQGGARPPIPTPTPSAPPEPSPCLAPAQDRAAGARCGTVSARDPVSARGWRPVLRVGHRAFILPQVLCSLNHGFNYLIFSSSEKEFSFPYSNQYSALCVESLRSRLWASPRGRTAAWSFSLSPSGWPRSTTPRGHLGGAAPRPCHCSVWPPHLLLPSPVILRFRFNKSSCPPHLLLTPHFLCRPVWARAPQPRRPRGSLL